MLPLSRGAQLPTQGEGEKVVERLLGLGKMHQAELLQQGGELDLVVVDHLTKVRHSRHHERNHPDAGRVHDPASTALEDQYLGSGIKLDQFIVRDHLDICGVRGSL
ncbi:MAG TPA: hypothetical protein VK095_00810 [Beutenbergiaceae bacterium]|nr:hypothetical protein [Beutenbergiaceae bacterium]